MRVVLVEGASDRAAVEVLARRLGAGPLEVVVLHGITNLRARLRDQPPGPDGVLLLHDAAESAHVERVLADAGSSAGGVRRFVCDADLEDELIRAVGVPAMLGIVGAQGERTAYDRMAQQPAQRDRTDHQRLRRWLGARSGHKLTYAALLAEAVPLDAVPAPLRDLLTEPDAGAAADPG
ncbi:ATP-dependent endonuclease [Nocardioides dongxiaopingii]|uniref:ATP-dependent endonuclease n=1 Tax=Nocardioides dongxiaopingii TaxID=2576036 RepID=UPI0010C76304|nr:ATP-dependent endonuclease [Nocardioides dongxiaopingii]